MDHSVSEKKKRNEHRDLLNLSVLVIGMIRCLTSETITMNVISLIGLFSSASIISETLGMNDNLSIAFGLYDPILFRPVPSKYIKSISILLLSPFVSNSMAFVNPEQLIWG